MTERRDESVGPLFGPTEGLLGFLCFCRPFLCQPLHTGNLHRGPRKVREAR